MRYFKKNSRDPRYLAAKLVIEADKVRTLDQLFQFIPKTIIIKDLGMKGDRFNACIRDPAKFRISHVYGMAELIGVDKYHMFEIVSKYWQDRSPRRFIKIPPPVKRLGLDRQERSR